MHPYDFDEWRRRAAAALRACEAHGGATDKLSIDPPATEDEVLAVERSLAVTIPYGFRYVVRSFAKSFRISWQLPADAHPPKPLKDILWGELEWSLDALPRLDAKRQAWVKDVFPDPKDEYDRVWHNKLAVSETSNGDFLALDLAATGHMPLVYLSHDAGKGHGYVIGPNFAEAFDRWTRLGCVGPEDWQWLPFVSSPTSGLEPESPNARVWRTYFGIDRFI